MELDLRGFYCPIPVLRAREELDRTPIGGILTVIADDPAAEEDLKRLARRTGNEVLESRNEGGTIKVVIRRVR